MSCRPVFFLAASFAFAIATLAMLLGVDVLQKEFANGMACASCWLGAWTLFSMWRIERACHIHRIELVFEDPDKVAMRTVSHGKS